VVVINEARDEELLPPPSCGEFDLLRDGLSLMLVRSSLRPTRDLQLENSLRSPFEDGQVEVVAIRCGRLSVIGLYVNPASPPAPFLRLLSLLPRTPCLVLGDLNARASTLGNGATNPRGVHLDNFLDESDWVSLLPPGPTFFRGEDVNSAIDVALASPHIPASATASVDWGVDTEHLPVRTLIPGDNPAAPGPPPTGIDWRAVDSKWRTSFPTILRDWTIQEDEDLDLMALRVTDALTPSDCRRPLGRKHSPALDSPTLRKLRRRRARARALRHHRRAKRLSKEIRQAERSALEERKMSLLRAFPRGGNYWKLFRDLAPGYKPAAPPPRESSHPVNLAKAYALMDAHLAVSNDPSVVDKTLPGLETDHLIAEERHADPLPKASRLEIRAAIFKARPRAAPGSDGITAPVLRRAWGNPDGRKILTLLVNASLERCRFPRCFKSADVLALPKPDGGSRPIALLSLLGKVLERVILGRIRLTWTAPTAQYASPGRRTTTAILKTELLVSQARCRGHEAGVLCADISKAFDRVGHSCLLGRLAEEGLPPALRAWIRSFLQDRRVRFKFRNSTTSYRLQKGGLPQGSPLSPALFTCFLGNPPAGALYADDLSLVLSGSSPRHIANRLTAALLDLRSWSERLGVRFNYSKFQFVTTARLGLRVPFEDAEIVDQPAAKLLGLILTRRAPDDAAPFFRLTEQALRDKDACRPRLNFLRRLARFPLYASTLLQAYKSVVRAKLAYGLLLLGDSDINMLEPVQHEGIRIALGAVRSTPRAALIAESRLPTLRQLRSSLAAATYFALKRDPHEDLFQEWQSSPVGPDPEDTTFGALWDSLPPHLPGFAQIAETRRLSAAEAANLDLLAPALRRISPTLLRGSIFAVSAAAHNRGDLSSSYGVMCHSPYPPFPLITGEGHVWPVPNPQEAEFIAASALCTRILSSPALPEGQHLLLGLPSRHLLDLPRAGEPLEEPALTFYSNLAAVAARFRVTPFFADPLSSHEAVRARLLCLDAAAGPRDIVPISALAFRALARRSLPDLLTPWDVWQYAGRYADFPPPPARWLAQPLPVVGLSFRARTGHERSGTQFNRLRGPGSAPGCPWCASQDGTVLHILRDCLSEEAEEVRLTLSPQTPLDDLATLRVLFYQPEFLSRAAELLGSLAYKW
jgi:hypothetical protein